MMWTVENGLKYKIKTTHISQINVGDTIKCRDGVIRTVCKSNIHYLQDIGTTIFGDSYNLGSIPVDKVTIFQGR